MTCFAKFLASRLRSFGFAFGGLLYALRTQGNIRVHLLASIIVVASGFGFGIGPVEWAILVGAIGLVWMAELLNTAVETLCDYVEPARADAIKHTKDLAAAAVLVSAICAAAMGALVFWPYLVS